MRSGDHHLAHVPLNETLVYVRALMQQAIEVEHSTVPLYLSAYWSIENASSEIAQTVHGVVIEEMLHMTIAANVLNAIGGAPMIDAPGFIPAFPLVLPLTNVSVDIAPLSEQTLRNFMLIEGVTNADKSIGAAYSYVLSLLEALCAEYGEAAIFTGDPALQVAAATFSQPPQTANTIMGLSDTVTALLGVAEQGGGCPAAGQEELWPEVSNISSTRGPLGGTHSHWARFASAHAGRAWRPTDPASGGPTGPRIAAIGAVRQFALNPRVDDYPAGTEANTRAAAFAGLYCSLLVQLHDVFNGAPGTYYDTLAAMHTMSASATAVLNTADPRKGVAPGTVVGTPWEYIPSASQYWQRGGKARPIVR